ncbi:MULTISPECIES: hypothetical protein [Leptolyngbya]|uniref:hypothetical protein n=1 Tax=Leptolyngbya TaxID=47251 RepID=UPI00168498B2|nr:hypothetical protein [Leptolyngbya sp. FACHB-1624]MBD1857896.1 hypothetical protein [Leptolyngbya sp. FACHB-1624]
MQNQHLQSISKFFTLSTLAMTIACTGSIPLILSSPSSVHAETRQQSVDSVTDWLFGNLNPGLNRRRLQHYEHGYIREWNAIRRVIDQGGLRYSKVGPNGGACGEPDWTFPNKDEALKERLADAVFHSRYPGRRGAPIRPNERAAMREWIKIKNSMSVAYC